MFWSFLFILLVDLATLVPMWILTERAGYRPVWSLFCLIPGGLIVLLWVLAVKPRAGGI